MGKMRETGGGKPWNIVVLWGDGSLLKLLVVSLVRDLGLESQSSLMYGIRNAYDWYYKNCCKLIQYKYGCI